MQKIPMKHLLFLAFLFFFLSNSLWAQKQAVELEWNCTALPATENEYECALVAGHFDDILSLQFTIRWDPDQTEFLKFAPISLPELNENNFNAQTATEGFIRFLWIDLSLAGISLSPGTPLFSLHVQTKNGQPELKLADDPLEIEILDSDDISRHLKWH